MHVDDRRGRDTRAEHALPFRFSMMLPAFRGVEAVSGIEGLTIRAASSLSTSTSAIRSSRTSSRVGVCVAIPPVGQTPLPVGVPKTGFMIESMATATGENLSGAAGGEEPRTEGTWNAVCLADFGDGGVAFVAQPQIPPRNLNWSSEGKWVHAAKIGFEKYFLRKVRRGEAGPFYEEAALKIMGIRKLKETRKQRLSRKECDHGTPRRNQFDSAGNVGGGPRLRNAGSRGKCRSADPDVRTRVLEPRPGASHRAIRAPAWFPA